jgi:CRP/FNR family cyclic AMP-dependent transcriptional regulator
MAKARAAPQFAGMAAADITRLLAAAARVQLRDQQSVFARGDAANSAYLVLSGSVRITTMGPSGKRITAEIFQRDEMFGEIGAIDDGVRTADATAMGPVDLVSIPATAFREVLAGSAPMANNLLREMLGRLRRTYTLLEDASLRTVEAHFARQVLYLLKLGTTGEQHVRLQVRMHQDELADLLGVTTRSVINVLNKWREEGLVNFDGRTAQLTILDIQRFRALIDD